MLVFLLLLITKGNTFWHLKAKAFEAILVSIFNKEMGSQFLMYLSIFSFRLDESYMYYCLFCELDNSYE